ncbi:MAG: hypothetical protein WC175_03310 [Candidatus Dojkabacteria bacterium]
MSKRNSVAIKMLYKHIPKKIKETDKYNTKERFISCVDSALDNIKGLYELSLSPGKQYESAEYVINISRDTTTDNYYIFPDVKMYIHSDIRNFIQSKPLYTLNLTIQKGYGTFVGKCDKYGVVFMKPVGYNIFSFLHPNKNDVCIEIPCITKEEIRNALYGLADKLYK